MGFCNSCGRPIVKEDYGTNKDGSPNDEYCIDCFQNGEFTEPDITLNEMIIRKTNSFSFARTSMMYIHYKNPAQHRS